MSYNEKLPEDKTCGECASFPSCFEKYGQHDRQTTCGLSVMSFSQSTRRFHGTHREEFEKLFRVPDSDRFGPYAYSGKTQIRWEAWTAAIFLA